MEFNHFFNVKLDIAQYHAIRDSLIQTCEDPQIWEVETKEGILLYSRFFNGEIACLEKWNGAFVCAGNPYLEKNSKLLTADKVEIYLEMYSKHKIKFI